ncbi:MAG TPA: hypothetical protein VJV05_01070 [Pyrinomonadaceae bacterium]|nr:hypothetical protein [Pyrinomonadaceae bacterium]
MPNPSAVRTRSRVATPSRELSWSFVLLVILCACFVAAGFFFAARQHFTAMEYSMKNSKLRDQIRSLENEKRRLELAREVAVSPTAIRKAARGIGMSESSEPSAVLASVKPEQEKIQVTKVSDVKSPEPKSATSAAVVRTVMTAPAQASPTGDTRSRVVDTRKEKKEGPAVAALLKLK